MKKIIVYDDYNQRIPTNQDIIGTITTMFGRNAMRAGFKIIEIQDDGIQNCSESREMGK